MASFRNRTFFTASEFNAPERMSNELISRLEMARGYAGVPFRITSSFREGDGTSAHDHGLAVDIDVTSSADRYRILGGLLEAGFTRVGLYWSEAEGHIHADVADQVDPSKWPPGVIWIGQSR